MSNKILVVEDQEDNRRIVRDLLTTTGREKENVEPCPGADSTRIFPPCISMMRFEIASPRPVPPFFLVIELSAC